MVTLGTFFVVEKFHGFHAQTISILNFVIYLMKQYLWTFDKFDKVLFVRCFRHQDFNKLDHFVKREILRTFCKLPNLLGTSWNSRMKWICLPVIWSKWILTSFVYSGLKFSVVIRSDPLSLVNILQLYVSKCQKGFYDKS